MLCHTYEWVPYYLHKYVFINMTYFFLNMSGHTYEWVFVAWRRIHMCDMTHSCVQHDTLIRAKWRIHIWNMTQSCLWSVCVSVCRSICLSVYATVCLSVYRFERVCMRAACRHKKRWTACCESVMTYMISCRCTHCEHQPFSILIPKESVSITDCISKPVKHMGWQMWLLASREISRFYEPWIKPISAAHFAARIWLYSSFAGSGILLYVHAISHR